MISIEEPFCLPKLVSSSFLISPFIPGIMLRKTSDGLCRRTTSLLSKISPSVLSAAQRDGCRGSQQTELLPLHSLLIAESCFTWCIGRGEIFSMLTHTQRNERSKLIADFQNPTKVYVLMLEVQYNY
ncbi:hypothetical protein RDI58_021929 [Solanum bulbocastanum]|uniref:Uncharacterized protein n=1 Tax=Solanum bulbocastanum TaxID=147425 RepID=A0AAN8T381_SOLBU